MESYVLSKPVHCSALDSSLFDGKHSIHCQNAEEFISYVNTSFVKLVYVENILKFIPYLEWERRKWKNRGEILDQNSFSRNWGKISSASIWGPGNTGNLHSG